MLQGLLCRYYCTLLHQLSWNDVCLHARLFGILAFSPCPDGSTTCNIVSGAGAVGQNPEQGQEGRPVTGPEKEEGEGGTFGLGVCARAPPPPPAVAWGPPQPTNPPVGGD